MINNPRRFWTSILFIGLFAPFVIVFVISLLAPAPATLPATQAAGASNPLSNLLAPARAAPTNLANAPIHAAGDGRDLWVTHPFTIEAQDSKPATPAYEILSRSSNSGVWSIAAHGGNSRWRNFPQGLAVIPLPPGVRPEAPAYVINDSGTIDVFTLTTKGGAERLPPRNIVKAAIGDKSGIFVLALGNPPAAATRPGDRLFPDIDYFAPLAESLSPTPASAPATQPESALATRPATASAPAAPALFNAYWFRESRWTLLPPLGTATTDPSTVPTPSSLVTLAVSGTRLLAIWVDATRPSDLIIRTLDFSQQAGELAWSKPSVTRLSEPVPAVSRLMTVTLDKSAYVLWSLPTGATVELHGGPLATDAPEVTLPSRTLNMSLGIAGQGIRPATDVIVGAAENAFIAVVCGKDGTLSSLTFNSQGQPLSGPTQVVPRPLKQDVRVGQNLAMVLLILAFSLALWQWRQKPITLTLPPGKVAAPLLLRSVAFLIDAMAPYIIVLIIFGKWENSFELMSTWLGAFARPDELFVSPEFLVFLGIYLLHVSVGEFLFRRSLGKSLVGLEVLMIDGRPPTLAAVLLRNLVRVPESIGFLILFMLISEHRQRLGDLLARTLVVAPEPPDADTGKKNPNDK